MLQSKVACWDLEDGEIADVDGDDSGCLDDEMSDSFDPPEDDNRASPAPRHHPVPQVHTACIKTPLLSQESTHQPSKGADVLEKISRTFDPELQSQCEAEQASSMFQSQQLLLLQSQVRDLNTTMLSLQTQLDDAECRRADQLQNQIDINTAIT